MIESIEMERVQQLLSLDADQSEDVMLRDFVNKRGMLLNETMRSLAGQCVRVCNEHSERVSSAPTKEQTEPRALPKFTSMEEVCLAKCESKMISLQQTVERHIDDSFNPSFVKKILALSEMPKTVTT